MRCAACFWQNHNLLQKMKLSITYYPFHSFFFQLNLTSDFLRTSYFMYVLYKQKDYNRIWLLNSLIIFNSISFATLCSIFRSFFFYFLHLFLVFHTSHDDMSRVSNHRTLVHKAKPYFYGLYSFGSLCVKWLYLPIISLKNNNFEQKIEEKNERERPRRIKSDAVVYHIRVLASYLQKSVRA